MTGPISRPETAVPAHPASTTLPADWRDDWFVFMVADISDEAAAAITKAGAWPAVVAFHRLLWRRLREAEKAGNEKGRAACAAGVLEDEGIKGLCRSMSSDTFKACPKAMSRQIDELVRIGYLAVQKPPAVITRDDRGRIVRKPSHPGLVPASKVIFAAGDELKRPMNRQGANRPLKAASGEAGQGANRPLKGRAAKGRSATTPISPGNISPSAGGRAGRGAGQPAEKPGLAAGKAGGHSAAGAGRLAAADQEERQARPFTGSDHDRFVWTMQRIKAGEAAKAAREAEDAARSQEAPVDPPEHAPPPDATQAASNLAAAVADLRPAEKQRAKKVARKMTKADRQAEAEAARLRELIERRRQEAAVPPPRSETPTWDELVSTAMDRHPPGALKAKAKAAFKKRKATKRKAVQA